jgi:hypothetical protein
MVRLSRVEKSNYEWSTYIQPDGCPQLKMTGNLKEHADLVINPMRPVNPSRATSPVK